MAKKPKPQILYRINHADKARQTYTIFKLSDEFEVISEYTLTEIGATVYCTCPAHVAWCRHCAMLRLFQEANKISSGWFYDLDAEKWIPPLSQDM